MATGILQHGVLRRPVGAVLRTGRRRRTARAPEITISPEATGGGRLYLRGDIGYAAWLDEGDPFYRSFGGTGEVSFDNARFDKPPSATIGLGYQFTDVIRADLTAEYFEGRFDGSSLSASPCAGEGAGTRCALSTAPIFPRSA